MVGFGKYDKLHCRYKDSPVEFVISDLPIQVQEKYGHLLKEIQRIYRLEVAYSNTLHDTIFGRKRTDIKSNLKENVKNHQVTTPFSRYRLVA